VNELAARFAAKEAVMKALGTGAKCVAWREIEVLPNHRGKPLVYLHGQAAERAEKIGLRGIDISLSHSKVGLQLAGSVDKNAVELTWNAPLPEGGSMLADEVALEATLVFVQAAGNES
jgi:hypothetical protein